MGICVFNPCFPSFHIAAIIVVMIYTIPLCGAQWGFGLVIGCVFGSMCGLRRAKFAVQRVHKNVKARTKRSTGIDNKVTVYPEASPGASGSTAAFCVNCGAARIGTAKFCGSCGTPFEAQSTMSY